MILPHRLTAELITQAREAAPFECCGIIGTRDGQAVKLYPARNVAANPTITYELDGTDQFGIAMELEQAALDLGAIYHSHPIGPAYPSGVDVATAYYPDAVYVIIGLGIGELGEPWLVRGFRILDGVVSEEELAG